MAILIKIKRKFLNASISDRRRINQELLFGILVILVMFSGPSLKASQKVTDDEIKAALLFKFPVYVKWPDDILPDNQKEFNCYIAGNAPIVELVRQFDGEKMMQKTIRVIRWNKNLSLDSCHLLFICNSDEEEYQTILKKVKGKPILTVGHFDGFAESGGIINFITKNDSVQFEINPKAAKDAGLTISSKLLRLAHIVDEE